MRIYDNGVYREMTAEEIMQNNVAKKAFEQTKSYGEIVDALIRQKYSVSAELAILRQRNEKPEEFAEYYQYCEECKRKARGEV